MKRIAYIISLLLIALFLILWGVANAAMNTLEFRDANKVFSVVSIILAILCTTFLPIAAAIWLAFKAWHAAEGMQSR